jgi:geranylgeranyl diphosphate synthase type I
MDELGRFVGELRERRDRVYDYLDNWPGASAFKPEDIHDGLFAYVRQRGKGLRPSLLMLSAGAVGGDEEQAIPAAAAVEIFHIWTLVHDDIIDRDEMRRGNPTVHAQYSRHAGERYGLPAGEAAHYGSAVAILSGDLQQSWSFALLCDLAERGVAPELILRLIRRMATSLTPQLLEGEMLDVQFAIGRADDLTEERILHMLAGKSAALLEYSAWAGATIGLGGRPDPHGYAESLGRFALLCGLGFQLQDDLLGLTADERELGKPVGSDLREGKRTLILHHALRRASDTERAALLSVIGRQDANNDDTSEALSIIKRTGALDEVERLASSFISQGLELLERIPESDAKGLLRSWGGFMLARSY